MNNICFALTNSDKCAILTHSTKCHIGCAFFKTQQQLIEGRRLSLMRLNKLPLHTQSAIADKYYRGRLRLMKGDGSE